jgi:chromosomal replication initiation ATPase DnaA
MIKTEPKMDVIDIVKDIIINESGVDINQVKRNRNIVEVRSLFFHVVKELSPMQSFSNIGRSVNKDHATVMFAISQYETYARFNKELDKLKAKVVKRFRLEYQFYQIHSIDDEIRNLEERIAELKELRDTLN